MLLTVRPFCGCRTRTDKGCPRPGTWMALEAALVCSGRWSPPLRRRSKRWCPHFLRRCEGSRGAWVGVGVESSAGRNLVWCAMVQVCFGQGGPGKREALPGPAGRQSSGRRCRVLRCSHRLGVHRPCTPRLRRGVWQGQRQPAGSVHGPPRRMLHAFRCRLLPCGRLHPLWPPW